MDRDLELAPAPRLAVSLELENHHEAMYEQLIADPSYRYRLRGALATFDIRPKKDLDLGYTRRPVIDMQRLVEVFELPIDAESSQGRDIALAFLGGGVELHQDFNNNLKYNHANTSGNLETFAQLPSFLQFLATFKVIGDHTFPLIKEEGRAKLKGYFTERIGMSSTAAESVLRSAAIVYADDVLTSILCYPEEVSTEAVGVDMVTLVGPANPTNSLHLGQDLEEAVYNGLRGHLGMMPDLLLHDTNPYSGVSEHTWEEYKNFWPEVSAILERATNIAGNPQEEALIWQSYLFTKAVMRDIFMPRRVEGFDAGIDQLVNWLEPILDKEYPNRLKGLDEWLAVGRKYNIHPRGIDLAKQAFVIETVEHVEADIVYGAKEKRYGRIATAALLLKEMRHNSPELVAATLARSPLIKTALLQTMDPWGFRFTER